MRIQLNLEITAGDETSDQLLEALRLQLRRQSTQFVFEAAESVGIHHRDININGDIKLIEG